MAKVVREQHIAYLYASLNIYEVWIGERVTLMGVIRLGTVT